MTPAHAAAMLIIVLHSPGGHEIDINARKIISMRETDKDPKKEHYVTTEARCVVNTEDGKFLSVVESCEEIRKLIHEAEKLAEEFEGKTL